MISPKNTQTANKSGIEMVDSNSLWRSLLLTALIVFLAGCATSEKDASRTTPTDPLNPFAPDHIVVPVNQVLTPAGFQVELPGLRLQVLTFSPDGKLRATSGKSHELILIEPVAGVVRQRVPLPSENAREETSDPVSSHILGPDKPARSSMESPTATEPKPKHWLNRNIPGMGLASLFGDMNHEKALTLMSENQHGAGFGLMSTVDGVGDSSSRVRMGVLWMTVSPDARFAAAGALALFSAGTMYWLRF